MFTRLQKIQTPLPVFLPRRSQKRRETVEGDLGVYVNRMKVIESIGEEKLARRM